MGASKNGTPNFGKLPHTASVGVRSSRVVLQGFQCPGMAGLGGLGFRDVDVRTSCLSAAQSGSTAKAKDVTCGRRVCIPTFLGCRS